MKNNFKHKLSAIAIVLQTSVMFGQVGINTENPQGIFNIDGGKDNPKTGSAHTQAQQLNDFTVLANGNTGIGTIAPTQKLDIRTGGTPTTPVTGFRLIDGNEGVTKVLTSDANGVGTWKPYGLVMLAGTFVSNSLNLPIEATPTDWHPTGGYVTVPPGLWRIDMTQLLAGRNVVPYTLPNDVYAFVRFSLTDDSATTGTVALTNDFIKLQPDGSFVASPIKQYVSTTFQGPQDAGTPALKYAIATGNMTIYNSGTTEKNYYIATQVYRTNASIPITNYYFQLVGSSAWGENTIYAIRLNITN